MDVLPVRGNEVRRAGWPGTVGRTALLLLTLGLASCAGLAPSSKPVPVEDRASRTVPPPPAPKPAEGAPQAQPALPPDASSFPALPTAPDRPVGETPRTRPPAVVALLERVDSVSRAGNNAQAAAELERALRITPRDGDLWLRLARVRMQQRQWQQAEAMALKCLSLPESDAPTKKAAWDLIGSARKARGDHPGAEAARQRAAAIGAP